MCIVTYRLYRYSMKPTRPLAFISVLKSNNSATISRCPPSAARWIAIRLSFCTNKCRRCIYSTVYRAYYPTLRIPHVHQCHVVYSNSRRRIMCWTFKKIWHQICLYFYILYSSLLHQRFGLTAVSRSRRIQPLLRCRGGFVPTASISRYVDTAVRLCFVTQYIKLCSSSLVFNLAFRFICSIKYNITA